MAGFLGKKVAGHYPSRLLNRKKGLMAAAKRRVLRWALDNPITSVEDPYAYEYVIHARKKI